MVNVIVNLQVQGFHNWPDAIKLCPAMGFLSDMHRHMFYINCKKEVTNDDRQIEIIHFKNQIQDYLYSKYVALNNTTICEFGSKSCESIARELFEEFDLNYCSVLEDNENGAEVYK